MGNHYSIPTRPELKTMWDFLEKQQVASALAFAIGTALVCYLLSTSLHLRKIPGPFIAKFTDIHRYVLARGGLIHLYQTQAHQKYGPVVRFGTNMVSICDPEAISTVFHMRNGFKKACDTVLIQSPLFHFTSLHCQLLPFTCRLNNGLTKSRVICIVLSGHGLLMDHSRLCLARRTTRQTGR